MFHDPVFKKERDAEGVPLANISTGERNVLSGMYLFNSVGLRKFADAVAGWHGEDKKVQEGTCKDNLPPDIALSKCMTKDAHVAFADTRDAEGRERFHGFTAKHATLLAAGSAPHSVGWYAERSLGPLRDGLRSIAPESVAFRDVAADEIEAYERALYGACEGGDRDASGGAGGGGAGGGDSAAKADERA